MSGERTEDDPEPCETHRRLTAFTATTDRCEDCGAVIALSRREARRRLRQGQRVLKALRGT